MNLNLKIIEFANEIYSTIGPGYSERVYHNAMEVLLRKNNIPYETEKIVPIVFENHTIGNLRIDLVIDDKMIVELKATKSFNETNNIQLRNYMKLTGIEQGMLLNFPPFKNQEVLVESLGV